LDECVARLQGEVERLKDRECSCHAGGMTCAEVEESVDAERAALQARAEAAEAEVAALRGALEELMDWQNGPPLITYTEGWNAAMAKARAALARGGKGE
jgi:hypothetical protein